MGDRLGIPGVVGILFAVHKRAPSLSLGINNFALGIIRLCFTFSVNSRLSAAFSDYPTRLSETNQKRIALPPGSAFDFNLGVYHLSNK